MKLPSKKLLWLLPLLLAALAVAWFIRRDKAGGDPEQYRTEAVHRGPLTQSVSATGTLNPVRVVSVGTQVSGTVKKLYVDFNSHVKAGQLLLELDTAQLDAKLLQSRATLNSSQAKAKLTRTNLARMQDLFKQNYVSHQELEQAEADNTAAIATVTQSAAQVDRDRLDVQNAIIRSPVDGVVIDRQVDEGQTVAASYQTPTLVKIAQDLTKMQINASVAEADLGRIKEGMHASFTVDAFSERNFEGEVRQIRLNPTTTSNVVTYDVVVDVANPRLKLLPGMTAYVDIEVGKEEDALLVPNAALRYKPAGLVEQGWKKGQRKEAAAKSDTPAGKPDGEAKQDRPRTRPGRVFVLRDGKAVAAKVKTGLSDGRYTAVSSDELKDGDVLIVGEKVDAKAQAGKVGGTNNQRRPFGPGM